MLNPDGTGRPGPGERRRSTPEQMRVLRQVAAVTVGLMLLCAAMVAGGMWLLRYSAPPD